MNIRLPREESNVHISVYFKFCS